MHQRCQQIDCTPDFKNITVIIHNHTKNEKLSAFKNHGNSIVKSYGVIVHRAMVKQNILNCRYIAYLCWIIDITQLGNKCRDAKKTASGA